MATKQPTTFSDQIRAEVDAADQTRYVICQSTGIDQSAFSKFMRGERGLSLESLDKLAGFLNLEITVRKSRETKGR